MEKQLELVKNLLKEHGLENIDGTDIDMFIKNYMPLGNADYQQEYFLMELKNVIIQILSLRLN